GVSSQELENEKINLLNNLKTIVSNKESIKNDIYMDSIVDYILNNNVFMEPDAEYELTENILKSITIDDLKNIASNLTSLNYDVLITSRENMKDKLPKTNEIKSLIDLLLTKNTTSIEEKSFKTELPELNLIPGTSKIITKEKDYTKLLLSNGIEVLYKETNFDKDKITFKLTKLQGSSSLEYPEYINSLFLPEILSNSGVGDINYSSLELYFKGKNFSVEPFIDDYTQGFTISTNKENLSEALKFFRTLISNPKFDENIIESNLKTNRELIKNRDFSPKALFKKTYLETLNNNHPRKVPLEIDDISYVNKESLLNTFEHLFSNFKNYKLVVTGSIDEQILIKNLDYYFANLPINTNQLEYKDLNVVYPTESVKKTIIKGIDKKATVILTFPYQSNFSLENRVLYGAFSNLLNILLIEDVREKIGGVYSISSYSNLEKLNFGENYLQIMFSTDTKRVDEVVSKVKNTIEN
ncbi:MAG: M16 family metallopeptidase, partial [Cetobacterium somerae]